MPLKHCPICNQKLPIINGECEVCLITRTYGTRHPCKKCGKANAFCPNGYCQPSCENFLITKEEINHRKLVNALNYIEYLKHKHEN